MAQGNPAPQNSNLHRAKTPTYDWWRRPASLRLWHGHPGGGTGAHPGTHPVMQKQVADVRREEGGRHVQRITHTCDELDSGVFFGDLFTLKVLLRKEKKVIYLLCSIKDVSEPFLLKRHFTATTTRLRN